MGLFDNTGYDKYSNPKDSMGYSYDRNSGSHLGKVDEEDNTADRFFGRLIRICFVIYIVPGFMTSLERNHPEIRMVMWLFLSIWICRNIRILFFR